MNKKSLKKVLGKIYRILDAKQKIKFLVIILIMIVSAILTQMTPKAIGWLTDDVLNVNGVLFGGIYDDRFLVKKVDRNGKYNMMEAIPYDDGKAMYLVDDVDNQDILRGIVLDNYNDLKGDK